MIDHWLTVPEMTKGLTFLQAHFFAAIPWWWSVTENQTHISAVSQPRSEALRPSRDSGEGFRATAHAHDCKFGEADWHSQLPQLPGNLGDATWLSSRLSP